MAIPDLLIDMLIVVVGAVVGFGVFYGVDTALWSDQVKLIWNFVPLVFIAGAIIILILKLKLVH